MLDDRLAELTDIDPNTRSAVHALLGGMTDADRSDAATIRQALLAELGSFSSTWPEEIPPGSAAAWVSAVLGAVPAVADWMRAAGIPEPTIAATLGDVGRHLRLEHRNTGRTGFDAPVWMLAVMSGSLYQLGRLQFDLRRRHPLESVLPAGFGEWVLDVHIPEAGPLTPDAVAASLRRGGPLLRRALSRPSGPGSGLRVVAARSVPGSAPGSVVQHGVVPAPLHRVRRAAGRPVGRGLFHLRTTESRRARPVAASVVTAAARPRTVGERATLAGGARLPGVALTAPAGLAATSHGEPSPLCPEAGTSAG